MNLTSRKDICRLHAPAKKSHKWQNGSIVVIGGSHRYHGAPMLALTAASKFVDIVHFASTENFRYLLPKMRGKLFEFIPIFSGELEIYINHVDVVLIGPGFGINAKNKKLINTIIKKFPTKKIVLDAGALRQVNPRLLSFHHICTPNQREFKDIFGVARTPANTRKIAKKYSTTIVAKGPATFIATPRDYAENHTGDPGLTKGGTGDVLAGVLASFFAKNNPFVSAKAATFLVGTVARLLAKQRSFAYSASDVIQLLTRTFGRLRKP